MNAFENFIQYIIRAYSPHIILGDFNLNSQNFTNIMTESGYSQIITDPTHITGSLLDHVYVTPYINSQISYAFVEPLYFSDHDAIIIELN